MLILERNPGQSFFVGDDVKVTILEPRDGRIRVGIVAPKEIGVHREEVLRRIKAAAKDV